MTFASVVKDMFGYLAKYLLLKFWLMLGAFTGIWSQQGLLATRWILGVCLGSESLLVVGATPFAADSGVWNLRTWKSKNPKHDKSQTQNMFSPKCRQGLE